MVDSGDITFEKNKTQEIPLKLILSNNFYRNATVTKNSSESPPIQAVEPKNKSKPQFKKVIFSP